MKILLLRHGATAGNLERRYIGRTDQPLSPQGEQQARQLVEQAVFPQPELLVVSPLLRCRQTAAIVFPGSKQIYLDDLREFDFGDFEGRTATEMAEDPAYQQWVAGFCNGPCPGGESNAIFKERCCRAFQQLLQEHALLASMALVIHGGSIMAILERFAQPQQDFYAYHVGNCGYFLCETETANGTTILRLAGGSQC